MSEKIVDSEDWACEITIESTQKCLEIRSKARETAMPALVDHAAEMAVRGYLETTKKLRELGFVVAPLEKPKEE